ncbi:hypothetical protein MFM001_23200 [Mycobacterium sp. MFM001]|uniref:hypothetical protein n=1 Tax=Mycobacterium sp. MFM001 TaxID=2049453 RepID=UPI000DA5C46C|nr:hypothetical protein [Mycobacterium sp. MFM001]GBE65858.1 hypothetical protein MFM001_23200 [Mycobacterium sp. MFM001]
MKQDDPQWINEMLRTGMLGIFNYGLEPTPPWMRTAIGDVAEQVKRKVQGASTPVPIGGGLDAAPISSDDALWYRAAVATQNLLADALGTDGPSYTEFCEVLWELPPAPVPK